MLHMYCNSVCILGDMNQTVVCKRLPNDAVSGFLWKKRQQHIKILFPLFILKAYNLGELAQIDN